MSIEYRDYQNQAVDLGFDNFIQRKNGILYLATGTGKTVIAAELARRIDNRILFLVHRDELAKQTVSKFKYVWPEVETGIVKAGQNEIDKQVVIASVQTLARDKRLAEIKDQKFAAVFVDECHHSAANSWKKILNTFDCPRIGLTATPVRSDRKSLQELFGQIIFKYTIHSGIKDGYLSKLRGVTYRLPADFNNLKITCGDFQVKQLESVLTQDEHIDLVVNSWIQEASDRKTIVFSTSIAHAEKLEHAFGLAGYYAKAISNKNTSDERQVILNDFEDNNIQILISCMILTEGFDEPSVNCVVMARPTMSESLYIQMVGRGLRLFPGKEDCLVIDVVGNTLNHNIMQLGTLLGKEEEESIEFEQSREKYNREHKLYNIKKPRNYNWLETRYGKVLSLGYEFGWLLIRKKTPGYTVYQVKPSGGKDIVTKLNEEPLPYDWCVSLAETEAQGLLPHADKLLKRDRNWKAAAPTEKQMHFLTTHGLPVSMFKGECADTITIYIFEQRMAKHEKAKNNDGSQKHIKVLEKYSKETKYKNTDLAKRIKESNLESATVEDIEALYYQYLWEKQKEELNTDFKFAI